MCGLHEFEFALIENIVRLLDAQPIFVLTTAKMASSKKCHKRHQYLGLFITFQAYLCYAFSVLCTLIILNEI